MILHRAAIVPTLHRLAAVCDGQGEGGSCSQSSLLGAKVNFRLQVTLLTSLRMTS